MPTIDNNILLYVAHVIATIGNHKVGGVCSGAIYLCSKRCNANGASSWQLLVQEEVIAFIKFID